MEGEICNDCLRRAGGLRRSRAARVGWPQCSPDEIKKVLVYKVKRDVIAKRGRMNAKESKKILKNRGWITQGVVDAIELGKLKIFCATVCKARWK